MESEETSVERNDFYFGELLTAASNTSIHHQICQNINSSLIDKFKPKGYFISIGGVRLELTKEKIYVYPDVFLTFNEQDKKNNFFKRFPALIFEIQSDSTALYDRDVKLANYLKIPELNYYVLVSQKEIWIEIYSRTKDDGIWNYQSFENIDQIIKFDKLDFELPLATIYDSIEFDEEPDNKSLPLVRY